MLQRRLVVLVEPDQHRKLKELAAERGVSVAALVRQGIELATADESTDRGSAAAHRVRDPRPDYGTASDERVQTEVQLTRSQHRFLRELSTRTGESLSSLVRQAIDRLRQRIAGSARRSLDLIGAFEADRDDVSVRHDDYFASGSE
jgi:hypothetical protein